MSDNDKCSQPKEETPLINPAHVPQYLACGILSLGGFLGGTVTGWSSTALPSLQSSNHFPGLNKTDLSWIASIATLGSVAGSPAGGYLIRVFGRKKSLFFSSIPFALGYIALTFPLQVWMLYAGRFLAGVGFGLMALAGSVYLSEIAKPELRGRLCVIWYVMIRIGTILEYAIGSFLPYDQLSAISALLSLAFGASIFFLPESPRWLVSQNRIDDAVETLCWLQACEKSSPSQNILDEVEEDACGGNTFSYYTVQIFDLTGSPFSSHASGVIIGVAQLFGILFTAFCVDRVGRRILLLVTFLIMTLSLGVLGLFQQFKNETDDFSNIFSGWIPLLSFICYHWAYSGGPYALSYTISSEVIPTNVIGSVAGLVTAIGWMSAFIFTRSYQDMIDGIGVANSFWVFAGLTAIGGICIKFLIPETVGRRLENIHKQTQERGADEENCEL
ncbi:unnamed protein product [Orchesella dallaii]|uniref:Major facilitator superfamily (MFS) profile domain-containing protein n=1 Tax=Orchesella dallaii TaxID=48710 RepID=A0ABP1RLN6_9HEXA